MHALLSAGLRSKPASRLASYVGEPSMRPHGYRTSLFTAQCQSGHLPLCEGVACIRDIVLSFAPRRGPGGIESAPSLRPRHDTGVRTTGGYADLGMTAVLVRGSAV